MSEKSHVAFPSETGFGHIADGQSGHIQAEFRSFLTGHFQRRKGISRLTGLTDRDKQCSVEQNRITIAIFAGHLDTAGQSDDVLKPVTCYQPGMIAGATGHNLHPLDPFKNLFRLMAEGLHEHLCLGHTPFQGVADRLRLLMNLLVHVMLMRSQLDRCCRQG